MPTNISTHTSTSTSFQVAPFLSSSGPKQLPDRSAHPDGAYLSERARSTRLCPFTEEEDRALKAGYDKHGTVWEAIVKDPIFQAQNRCSTDLCERFRNAFPDLYEAAEYKLPNPAKRKLQATACAAIDEHLHETTADRRKRRFTTPEPLHGGTKSAFPSLNSFEEEDSPRDGDGDENVSKYASKQVCNPESMNHMAARQLSLEAFCEEVDRNIASLESVAEPLAVPEFLSSTSDGGGLFFDSPFLQAGLDSNGVTTVGESDWGSTGWSHSFLDQFLYPDDFDPPSITPSEIIPELYVLSTFSDHETTSSIQSYYTANTSILSYSTTDSTSTQSSDMSFPYSVTSINSRKSRKNVLYPRRVHPPPVAVSSEHSLPPDALIRQVRFLCTTLLPYAETRLMPAGRVLLRSMGLDRDFSPLVPIQTDKETLCCSELFIALTHDVLLKDAVGAQELEGPSKLLHTTYNDILFKLGTFSFPPIQELDEAGLKAPSAGALKLERFSNVLHALCSVMDAFEDALNTIKIKPAVSKDGGLGDRYRMTQLELSASSGLTMEQYRKKLDQNLAQTQTQLNTILGRALSHPTSILPVIHPHGADTGPVSTNE